MPKHFEEKINTIQKNQYLLMKSKEKTINVYSAEKILTAKPSARVLVSNLKEGVVLLSQQQTSTVINNTKYRQENLNAYYVGKVLTAKTSTGVGAKIKGRGSVTGFIKQV